MITRAFTKGLSRRFNKTDASAGLLFIAFGLLFGWQSIGMELGTALRMGPGYFPLILSAILILLGCGVILAALDKVTDDTGTYAWRGMVFILSAPILFGLTVQGLGFVVSIAMATLIASRASLKMGWRYSALLTLGVTAFSTLVFSFGLGLPFQRFGPWLPFF